jgi:GntR family phosphonate transport system transcriptional regulator
MKQATSNGPMWRRIEAALQSEIVTRALGPGAQLPPEDLVAARFGVSRLTARKALASLQAQGFIRIEPGRGTFVQDTIFPYQLGREGRFCHYLSSVNVTPGKRLLSRGRVEADERVARELALEIGAPVVSIRVLGTADDRPVLVSHNFFPAARFTGLDDVYARKGSINESLSLFGIGDKRRARCELISRMPTAEEARLLQQPRTRPVTEMELTMVDESGTPIWLDISCFSGDRVRFAVSDVVQLPVDV